MNTNRLRVPAWISLTLLVVLSAVCSRAETVGHRWDFGTISSPVESGWTQTLSTTTYGGTTSGFSGTLFYSSFDRETNTWLSQPSSFITITNLQRDFVTIRKGTSPTDALWRDVIPLGATNATFTFYLGDPADANFGTISTLVAFASTTNFVGSFVSAHPTMVATSFTGQVALNGGAPTLDFLIQSSSATDGSLVRWSGLEILYAIPEPGATALLACAMMALVALRQGARRNT